jgi:hypothetical protein
VTSVPEAAPPDQKVPAVDAEGLVKTYKSRAGTVEAVRGVDLRVEAGEVFGFLGPIGEGHPIQLRQAGSQPAPTLSSRATPARGLQRSDEVGRGRERSRRRDYSGEAVHECFRMKTILLCSFRTIAADLDTPAT